MSGGVPEIYEFHVTGLIGPVVRAALPELTADPSARHSVLTGTAAEPPTSRTCSHRLTDHGLVTDHIVIPGRRWQDHLARHGRCDADDSGA